MFCKIQIRIFAIHFCFVKNPKLERKQPMKEALEKVKTAFEKSGWTYEGLAIKSGVPEQTVKNIIKGRTADPRFDTLHRLTDALEAYIGDPAEEAEKHAETQPQPDDYRESLIAALYERIDVDEQRYKEKITDIRTMYEKEISEVKELYEARISEDKRAANDQIKLKNRWICILAASIAMLMLFIVGYIFYDLRNPEMGIFRYEAYVGTSDFAHLNLKNPNLDENSPYLDTIAR